jgi:hypothetical protein
MTVSASNASTMTSAFLLVRQWRRAVDLRATDFRRPALEPSDRWSCLSLPGGRRVRIAPLNGERGQTVLQTGNDI